MFAPHRVFFSLDIQSGSEASLLEDYSEFMQAIVFDL
jgi:hypothetical protein